MVARRDILLGLPGLGLWPWGRRCGVTDVEERLRALEQQFAALTRGTLQLPSQSMRNPAAPSFTASQVVGSGAIPWRMTIAGSADLTELLVINYQVNNVTPTVQATYTEVGAFTKAGYAFRSGVRMIEALGVSSNSQNVSHGHSFGSLSQPSGGNPAAADLGFHSLTITEAAKVGLASDPRVYVNGDDLVFAGHSLVHVRFVGLLIVSYQAV